jgi:hypothetical protein
MLKILSNSFSSQRPSTPLPQSGFLSPWTTDEVPVEHVTLADRPNLFNVRKTKAAPAGHVEPVDQGPVS